MVIIDIDPHRDDRGIGHTVTENLKVVAAVLALTDVAPAIVGVGVKVVAVRYILVVFHPEPAVPAGVAQICIGVAVVVGIGRIRLVGAVAVVRVKVIAAVQQGGVDFRLGVAALKDHGHAVILNRQQVALAGVGHGRGVGVGQWVEVAVPPLEADELVHIGFACAVRAQLKVEGIHINKGELFLGEGVLVVEGGFQYVDAHVGVGRGGLCHVAAVGGLLLDSVFLDKIDRHALAVHIGQRYQAVFQGACAGQTAAIQLQGVATQRPLAVGFGTGYRCNALALVVQIQGKAAAKDRADLAGGTTCLGAGRLPGALVGVGGVGLACAQGTAYHCNNDHQQEHHGNGKQNQPLRA